MAEKAIEERWKILDPPLSDVRYSKMPGFCQQAPRGKMAVVECGRVSCRFDFCCACRYTFGRKVLSDETDLTPATSADIRYEPPAKLTTSDESALPLL